MADIVVDTGNLDISGQNVRIASVLIGESINPGESLTLISGEHFAGTNASSEDSEFVGISFKAGVSGEWISCIKSGPMSLGAGLVQEGNIYVMSSNDGGIMDITGITATDFVSVVGYGLNDDFIFVKPIVTDKQKQ